MLDRCQGVDERKKVTVSNDGIAQRRDFDVYTICNPQPQRHLPPSAQSTLPACSIHLVAAEAALFEDEQELAVAADEGEDGGVGGGPGAPVDAEGGAGGGGEGDDAVSGCGRIRHRRPRWFRG